MRLLVGDAVFSISANVPQLPEGGEFEPQNYQQKMNLNRNKNPDLTTEPPLLGRCCYGLPFLKDNALDGLCKIHN